MESTVLITTNHMGPIEEIFGSDDGFALFLNGMGFTSYFESKSLTFGVLEIVFSITLENDYCIMKVGEKIEASKECFAVSLLPWEREKKNCLCVAIFPPFVLYWNKTLKSSQSRSRTSYAKRCTHRKKTLFKTILFILVPLYCIKKQKNIYKDIFKETEKI